MPSWSAASFAFVALLSSACSLAACTAAPPLPRAVTHFSEVEPAPEPPPALLPAQPQLMVRDDFRHVEGVLLSPDGRYLAVADAVGHEFGCVGSVRTTVWLYDTQTWHATVVRPLSFDAAAWAFAEDGSALVLLPPGEQSEEAPGPEAITLINGAIMPASVAPLAPLSPSSRSGALLATSAGAHVQIARDAKPWLRLGPPVAAVAAGGALESGEVFFAARWPNGSFALWDVERSKPIEMVPPPPERVTGVAVEEDVLLLAGRDGSFWRYVPAGDGVFDGAPVPRNDALVRRVFDVRAFAGREKTDEWGVIGLLGGDPDAPLTRRPASVSCSAARCRFGMDDDSQLRVFASDQPGEVSVWDGLFTEPFGGDAGTAFLCVEGARVVEPERCSDWRRVPRLFTQARLRAEARARPRPG